MLQYISILNLSTGMPLSPKPPSSSESLTLQQIVALISLQRLKILEVTKTAYKVEYDGIKYLVTKADESTCVADAENHRESDEETDRECGAGMSMRLELRQTLHFGSGDLFQDEAVPEDFREVMIFHELREKEYKEGGFEDAHNRALNDELLYVMKHFDPEQQTAYCRWAKEYRERKLQEKEAQEVRKRKERKAQKAREREETRKREALVRKKLAEHQEGIRRQQREREKGETSTARMIDKLKKFGIYLRDRAKFQVSCGHGKPGADLEYESKSGFLSVYPNGYTKNFELEVVDSKYTFTEDEVDELAATYVALSEAIAKLQASADQAGFLRDKDHDNYFMPEIAYSFLHIEVGHEPASGLFLEVQSDLLRDVASTIARKDGQEENHEERHKKRDKHRSELLSGNPETFDRGYQALDAEIAIWERADLKNWNREIELKSYLGQRRDLETWQKYMPPMTTKRYSPAEADQVFIDFKQLVAKVIEAKAQQNPPKT
jgi:hypothetical protein